jgi:hypothetical protein
MENPAWQRVTIDDVQEALWPGVGGWADEAMAVMGPWDFGPSEVRCSLTWWQGEHDRNAPITAFRRLVAGLNEGKLNVWRDAGHLEWYRHDETLAELPSR